MRLFGGVVLAWLSRCVDGSTDGSLRVIGHGLGICRNGMDCMDGWVHLGIPAASTRDAGRMTDTANHWG